MPSQENKPHLGKKVERIRTIRGIKQETLAATLGLSQAAISRIEHSQSIDDEKLTHIAKALGVTAETIKNFDETASSGSSNFFQAPVHFQDHAGAIANNLNSLEKIVELYERLLESDNKRIALLESKLEEQKKTA